MILEKVNIYIETYGCQMNVADTNLVKTLLNNQNNNIVNNISEADIILINTCSVRDNAEQKIFNRLDFIKGLKRKNKKIKLGIIGCMAQRLETELFNNKTVDFVVGPDNYKQLPEIIYKIINNNNNICATTLNAEETYSELYYTKQFPDNSLTAYIPIMRGCNNFCTYCIVPYTRGRERSTNYKDILELVDNMKSQNYKEIVLLGQNVNSYEFKTNTELINFPKLLSLVAENNKELRIRFTTSHPKDLSDELIDTIANYKNICNHIHLAMQSGSNKVLKNMNRNYTIEWFFNRVDAIRSKINNCSITTDVFCGFAGETNEDFEQTLSALKRIAFDSAFMFKYSQRTGTYAAKHLVDNVPENEKIERLNKMIKLQNNISLEKNKMEIGKIFDVLIENYSKKSNNYMFGRTDHNKVVVFPANNFKFGQIVKTKVIDASSATLKGIVIED